MDKQLNSSSSHEQGPALKFSTLKDVAGPITSLTATESIMLLIALVVRTGICERKWLPCGEQKQRRENTPGSVAQAAQVSVTVHKGIHKYNQALENLSLSDCGAFRKRM